MIDDDLIVIVTNQLDPHADKVIHQLVEMGQTPVRLNTEEINMHVQTNIHIDSQDFSGFVHIMEGNRQIEVAKIKSVWWRRPVPYGVPKKFSKQERTFALKETEAAYMGIWSSLQCYWISFPLHIRQADFKVEQLVRARRFGFKTPKTLVTNSPDQVRSFLSGNGEGTIYKVLTDPFLFADAIYDKSTIENSDSFRVVRTTLVSDENVELINSVRYVPCLFQEYIPKAFELRVTVVGNRVFTAKIDSQKNELTKVDFRNWSVDIPYELYELPDMIKHKCLELVKSYGLNYSAMDFIVTPNNDIIFLESNPSGQFGWIEDEVPELDISSHLASCLIAGKNL